MSINYQNAAYVLSAGRSADFILDEKTKIVFAGKSNVGKSSVINRILRRKNFARVGESPGKTCNINYFLIDSKFYLIDLPGYGYAKVPQNEKARWAQLMETFFRTDRVMDFGVMIVDARHKPTANDIIMADFFKNGECPFVIVANKTDKCKNSELQGNLQCIRETLELPESVPVIAFSAEKGTGREELIRIMEAYIKG